MSDIEFKLPLPNSAQDSLTLILYRWNDNFYDKDYKYINDGKAVVAITDVFNDMLKERNK